MCRQIMQMNMMSSEGFGGKLIYNLFSKKALNKEDVDFYLSKPDRCEEWIRDKFEPDEEQFKSSAKLWLDLFQKIGSTELKISQDDGWGATEYKELVRYTIFYTRFVKEIVSFDFKKDIAYEIEVERSKEIEKEHFKFRTMRKISNKDDWFSSKENYNKLISLLENYIKECSKLVDIIIKAIVAARSSKDDKLRRNVCTNIFRVNRFLPTAPTTELKRTLGSFRGAVLTAKYENEPDDIELPDGIASINDLFAKRKALSEEQICLPKLTDATKTVKDFLRILTFFATMSDKPIQDEENTAREYADRLNSLELRHVSKVSKDDFLDGETISEKVGFGYCDVGDLGKLERTTVAQSPWMKQEVIDLFTKYLEEYKNLFYKAIPNGCKSKNSIKAACCESISNCERPHPGDYLFSNDFFKK